MKKEAKCRIEIKILIFEQERKMIKVTWVKKRKWKQITENQRKEVQVGQVKWRHVSGVGQMNIFRTNAGIRRNFATTVKKKDISLKNVQLENQTSTKSEEQQRKYIY